MFFFFVDKIADQCICLKGGHTLDIFHKISKSISLPLNHELFGNVDYLWIDSHFSTTELIWLIRMHKYLIMRSLNALVSVFTFFRYVFSLSVYLYMPFSIVCIVRAGLLILVYSLHSIRVNVTPVFEAIAANSFPVELFADVKKLLSTFRHITLK